MLLKLWSGALQTNRRTWTSQYLLCFLIYTHRYNSICSKFPPNAVNVNVFWSFPLLLPLLLLGCWRLVFPPMAADCNISPLAMFWNIIYSVFTVQFRIFEVPPTLTHTAPSLVIRSSYVIISLHDMSEYIWSKLYPVPLFETLHGFLWSMCTSYSQNGTHFFSSNGPLIRLKSGEIFVSGNPKELSQRHFYRGEAMQRWLANSPEETLVPGLFPEVPCDEGHHFYWTGVRSSYPCH